MRQHDDIEAIAVRRADKISYSNAVAEVIRQYEVQRLRQRAWLLQGPPLPQPPDMDRTWDQGLRELRLRVFWRIRRGA